MSSGVATQPAEPPAHDAPEASGTVAADATTASAPVLELRQVRKTYATGAAAVEALRGVDFVVETGEYVAVMGPSGSGKSTLMHIIGCLDVPSTGEFRLSGDDVSSLNEKRLAQVRNQQIGFVFQQFNLLPSLSAQRNVELPLIYSGVRARDRQQRAQAVLAQVGLADRLQHRPGELSGGQQQRVSIARALVTDPALLLADEPTGNLDSASTAEVLALFDQLHQAGRTIVLITHEQDVADRADRIAYMLDGLLTAAHPRVAAVSIGTGPAGVA